MVRSFITDIFYTVEKGNIIGQGFSVGASMAQWLRYRPSGIFLEVTRLDSFRSVTPARLLGSYLYIAWASPLRQSGCAACSPPTGRGILGILVAYWYYTAWRLRMLGRISLSPATAGSGPAQAAYLRWKR